MIRQQILAGKLYNRYIVLVLGIFLSLYSYAQPANPPTISLSAKTMDGKAIKKVAIGVPFMLSVEISHTNDTTSDICIDQLEVFSPRRVGVYVSTIQGVSRVRHSYVLLPKKMGTFVFNPTHYAGQAYQGKSSTLTIQVEDGGDKENTSAYRDGILSVQLITPKKRLYVGERVPVTLRIVFDVAEIQDIEFVLPEHDQVVYAPITEGDSYSIMYKGKSHPCKEWHWSIKPTVSGTMVMPAIRVAYVVHPYNRGPSLFSLLKKSAMSNHVYSNALLYDVVPLPVANKPFFAIGRLDNVMISAEPAIFAAGQASTVKLVFSGDAECVDTILPSLEGIPDTVSCHVAQSDHDTHIDKQKTFEYILHAHTVGDFTLPSYTFSYFNVDTGCYASISTAPIFVSVTEAATQAPVDFSYMQDVPCSLESIFGMDVSLFVPHSSYQHLPWGWFFVWLCVPFVILLMALYASYIHAGLHRLANPIYRFVYHRQLYKKLLTLEAQRSPQQVYDIFLDCIALGQSTRKQSLSYADIVRIVLSHEREAEYVSAWRQFFERAQASAFYTKSTKHNAQFFMQAKQLLKRLFFLLSLILLTPNYVWGNADSFNAMIDAFTRNDWKEAMVHGKALLPSDDPITLMVMARCAEHEHDMPKSVAYLRRAQRCGSYTCRRYAADMMKNIALMPSFAHVTQQESWWYEIGYMVPLWVWQWLLIISVVLACLGYYIFRHIWVWMIGILVWILGGYGLYICFDVQYRARGIVAKHELALRAHPIKKMPHVHVLPYLHEVYINEKKGDWYKISDNGIIGWVPVTRIELI